MRGATTTMDASQRLDAQAGLAIAVTVVGWASAFPAIRAGLHAFALPVPVPELTVSLLWHPRMDADPAHRWLRDCVRGICVDEPIDREA